MPKVLAQSNLPNSAAVVVSSETIILRDPNNSIIKKYTSDEQKQLSLKSYGIKPDSLLSPGENKTTPDTRNIIFYRWLQNVGEAYIDSLIKPKSIYKYEYAVNYVSGTNPRLYGASEPVSSGTSTARVISAYMFKTSSPNFELRIYETEDGNTFTSVPNITDSFEKITIEGGKVFVNEEEKATISTYNPEMALGINLFIFCLSNNNVPLFRGSFRLAYFKIFDENRNLLRDFVPASQDEVFGLYDKVSKTLFVNANENGSFVGGNDNTVVQNPNTFGFGNVNTPDVIDNDGEIM